MFLPSLVIGIDQPNVNSFELEFIRFYQHVIITSGNFGHSFIPVGYGSFADVWLWQHAKSKEKIGSYNFYDQFEEKNVY